MKNFSLNLLSITVALFMMLNVYLATTDQLYLYKTAFYNRVGIEDYKIFDNRDIPNGTPEPWLRSKFYNQLALDTTTSKMLTDYESVGYAVIYKDSLIYEKYFNGYSDSSHTNSFSMAKSMVSLLIGKALEEGKIKSIDEPVANYLEAFKTEEKKTITIKNVLQMSSGLSWDENYGDDILSGLVSQTAKGYYYGDLHKVINDLTVIEVPGTLHRYKSGDTEVLGMILEQATGEKLATYFSKKIWSQIGAEQSSWWSIDEKGHEKAYCCVNSSVTDFARIGKLMLHKGNWNGKQIIDSNWIMQSAQPCLIKDKEGKQCDYYGLQWWLEKQEGHNVIFARGHLGQFIFVIPDLELVIVRLGKKNDKMCIPQYIKGGINLIKKI